MAATPYLFLARLKLIPILAFGFFYSYVFSAFEDTLFSKLVIFGDQKIYTHSHVKVDSTFDSDSLKCEENEIWIPLHPLVTRFGSSAGQEGEYACTRIAEPRDSACCRVSLKQRKPKGLKHSLGCYSNSPADLEKFRSLRGSSGVKFDMKTSKNCRVRFEIWKDYINPRNPKSGAKSYSAHMESLCRYPQSESYPIQKHIDSLENEGSMRWYWLDSTHWLFTHTIEKKQQEGDESTAAQDLHLYFGDKTGLGTYRVHENYRGGKDMNWTTVYLKDSILHYDTEKRSKNNNFIPYVEKSVWYGMVMGEMDYRRRIEKQGLKK